MHPIARGRAAVTGSLLESAVVSQYAAYDPDAQRVGARHGTECVRPARPEDAAAIARISAEREGLDEDEIRPRVLGELTADGMGTEHHVFVAEVDRQVVGYGRIRDLTHADHGLPEVLREGWYLTGVVVAPEFRRRSLGAALTRARIEWVRARATEVHFVTNLRNHTSIDLHAAFGFEQIACEFEYPRAGLPLGAGAAFRLTLPD